MEGRRAFAIIPRVAVPELETYRRQFEDIRQQAQELTASLDEARFNWRPTPSA